MAEWNNGLIRIRNFRVLYKIKYYHNSQNFQDTKVICMLSLVLWLSRTWREGADRSLLSISWSIEIAPSPITERQQKPSASISNIYNMHGPGYRNKHVQHFARVHQMFLSPAAERSQDGSYTVSCLVLSNLKTNYNSHCNPGFCVSVMRIWEVLIA